MLNNKTPAPLSDEEYNKLKQLSGEIPQDIQKEIEKTREQLKEFKKQVTKKFPYIEAIGIIPPQATQLIEEEEPIKKEGDEKLIHLLMVVPDEKAKEILKLRVEIIKIAQKFKPKVWVHIYAVSHIWEMCFDGKYALVEALSMAYPLHDKGFLGGMRVASIHKTLVLKKFERYVTSYVIAGSFVRGTTVKTSDIDVAIVIDDTDVKRMSRFELKDKLRAIIHSYVMEAGELAGVKNKLSPQIYILTEFWESVKDAHPVIFTFIRDGVPLYDRGAFMPWKLLLRMGKIKPSPEAIDMFMALGDRVKGDVERKLTDIAVGDIYWGVITPSQAMLMLYGLTPPTPRETVKLMREVFVTKEKLMEKKYADIFEKIVDLYKKFEHDPKLTVSGKEVDTLLQESSDYITRLKELMKQIEKKTSEKELCQIKETVLDLLGKCVGKGSEQVLLTKLKEELIDKNKIAPRNLSLFREILSVCNSVSKTSSKKSKKEISKRDLASANKASHELTTSLLEYLQRKEFLEDEKVKVFVDYEVKEKDIVKKKKGELFMTHDFVFVIPDITSDDIKKIDKKGKLSNTTKEDLKESLKQKDIIRKINPAIFKTLTEIFVEFELHF